MSCARKGQMRSASYCGFSYHVILKSESVPLQTQTTRYNKRSIYKRFLVLSRTLLRRQWFDL